MPTNKAKPPKALVPLDTNKTSWTNGIATKTQKSGSENEKVLLVASAAVVAACGPHAGTGALREGDPGWSEGYQHALNLRILFNSLVSLASDLLHRGECLRIAPCGKILPVPDHGCLRRSCDDPQCERCAMLLYGQSTVEIVGTGKHLIAVDPDNHAYPYRHWDR